MGWGYFLGGEGDWAIDKNNPGQPGQYTGKGHKTAPRILV